MTGRRRHPARSAALSLLVGLAMLASLVGSATSARAQDDTATESEGGNNVEGNTYTSPDFGYAITWDQTWEVTDDTEDTDPTYNGLTLDNGPSAVVIEGIAGLEPLGYIDSITGYIEGDSSVSGFEQTEDDLDAEVPSAAYAFDYTNDDGDTINLTAYIEVRLILGGDAILSVFHTTDTASYDDEVGEREDLLTGLSPDGATAEVETDEPDPEDGGNDDDTASGDEAGSPDLDQASVPGGDGDRPTNEDELVDLIDTSIVDLNDYWARQFPLLSGGEEYVPPEEWVTWTGDIDSDCGSLVSFTEDFEPGDGPLYCPLDRTIYYDLNFANFQLDTVPNGFIISAVMAHELGHHIQDLLGLEQCYQTPCLDRSLLTSQEIEYMADCFAGAWSADAELRGRLGSADIDATIVEYAVVIGGSGFESADVGGHGRGSERIWWFLNGYIEGAARCLDTSTASAELLDETPTADETATPDETETPDATTVGLDEVVDLGDYTFEITRVRTRDAIDTEEPDEEQFVVVYFDAGIADDAGGPFDYASWTLVDGAGAVYEVDENATNQLLSSAYEDGIDQDLPGGSGQKLAMVFDVPAGVSGLTLVNEGAGLTVELDV